MVYASQFAEMKYVERQTPSASFATIRWKPNNSVQLPRFADINFHRIIRGGKFFPEEKKSGERRGAERKRESGERKSLKRYQSMN